MDDHGVDSWRNSSGEHEAATQRGGLSVEIYWGLMRRPFPLESSAVVAEDQLSATLGDEVVILGMRDSVYYGVSGVGTRLWELLATRRRIADLLETILAEYDVSRETAEEDIQALLGDLHERGLIVVTPPDNS